MNLVEAVSDSLFYRCPDGRIVFRPWGGRGPCYLLSERQRLVRAKVQLCYYLAMLGTIAFGVGELNFTQLILRVLLPFIVGGQFLHWLYSRGLSLTSPPEKASPEYIEAQLQKNNRAFGKPLLWVMLLISVAFVLAGVLIAVTGGPLDVALMSIVFFGFGAIMFARRLRNL